MKPTNHNWKPCSPGILRESATARRRTLLKLLGGGVILGTIVPGTAVGVLLTIGKQKPKTTPFAGGMACINVIDCLPDYVTQNVHDEVYQQIYDHLMKCKPCRDVYKALTQKPGSNRPHKATFKPGPGPSCQSPSP